jgi:hypothetical protein
MDGVTELVVLEVGAAADSVEGTAVVAPNVGTGVLEGSLAAGTLPPQPESKIAKATIKVNRFVFIGV